MANLDDVVINISIDNQPFAVKPSSSDTGWITKRVNAIGCPATSFGTLKEKILRGHSWVVAEFKGSRKNANWVSQQVFAVDIDDGMTPEDAHIKAKEFGLAIAWGYTSFSDSPVKRKFRLLFLLEQAVTDPKLAKAYTEALIRLFGGDGACKDLARLFYGGKDAIAFDGEFLDVAKLNDLLVVQAVVSTDETNQKRAVTKVKQLTKWNPQNDENPEVAIYNKAVSGFSSKQSLHFVGRVYNLD